MWFIKKFKIPYLTDNYFIGYILNKEISIIGVYGYRSYSGAKRDLEHLRIMYPTKPLAIAKLRNWAQDEEYAQYCLRDLALK